MNLTRSGLSLYPLVKFNLRSIWISKHQGCSGKSKKFVEILSFNPGEQILLTRGVILAKFLNLSEPQFFTLRLLLWGWLMLKPTTF